MRRCGRWKSREESFFGDAFATYGATSARLDAGLTGHEKPWWYYASLFGRQRNGGVLFDQTAFVLFAVAGVVIAFGRRRHPADFTPPSPASTLLRWAALYLCAIAVALSLPAYKTPWHAIHFVPALALLAAGALSHFVVPILATVRAVPLSLQGPILRVSPRVRLLMVVCISGMLLGSLASQAKLVAFTRPADARNPYAYVHTSRDALKFRPLAEAALARSPGRPIFVVSEEYWPLPWYFRGLPAVGYWATPPAECDGALVISSLALSEAVHARLHGAYEESIIGLRPGLLCVVFTPSTPLPSPAP